MSWGSLYFTEKNAWESLPLDVKLSALGFQYVNQDGNVFWRDPDVAPVGIITANGAHNFYTGADLRSGDPRQSGDFGGSYDIVNAWLNSIVAWNPRTFVYLYNVEPLDAPYNGATESDSDANIAPQNKGTLLQFLAFESPGGGQIVIDPQIGRVWVPNNPAAFNPFQNFVTNTGGLLSNAINKFMDSGGLVKAFAGAIIAPGLMDIYGNLTSAVVPAGPVAPGDALTVANDATSSAANFNDVSVTAPADGVTITPYVNNAVQSWQITPLSPTDLLNAAKNIPMPSSSSTPATVTQNPVTGEPVPAAPASATPTTPTTPATAPPGSAPVTPAGDVLNPSLMKLLPAVAAAGKLIAGGAGAGSLTAAQQAALANQQAANNALQSPALPVLALLAFFALKMG